ncbi:hypothetical protein [Deinococcus peraridilitoris]|uniref:Uncharacterized protein n=1 Tax=Deinococcus peraridilitoris (strain DSM 19664 / LMG 22246 / CIP 109416 / KR-200) TaxID=937777 RepID=K9ZZI5_DEIPD|nr:hypothetical protein [Deinococcus peraridilitoris]AFZ67058.1 hypothetical protein Deipe_1517 [Deinococcus peraridilitoris DSM 19664]
MAVSREEFLAVLALAWLVGSIGALSFQVIRWATRAHNPALYAWAVVMVLCGLLYVLMVSADVPGVLEVLVFLAPSSESLPLLSSIRTMTLAAFLSAGSITLELLARQAERTFRANDRMRVEYARLEVRASELREDFEVMRAALARYETPQEDRDE